jgi:hypothetical protein
MTRTQAYPAALLALALAGAGCVVDNRSRAGGEPSPGTTITVRGDWDDVRPALEHGAGRSEAAVVGFAGLALAPAEAIDNPTRRLCAHLVTGGDEPIEVRAWALSTQDPGPVRLTARVGRFGDRQREEHLLACVRRRLEDLAGVDWAPIRD